MHITNDCVDPFNKSTEQGCACIAGVSTLALVLLVVPQRTNGRVVAL
jgi:hypothetical protein